MRLHQGQLWQQADGRFVRLTVRDRLAVEYKLYDDLEAGIGESFQVTKKEFCRMIKEWTLIEAGDEND